ncbi:MAG TPA: hypothetical protein VFM65_10765 [Flavobacteriaceae bacterium]|nr:hypothetical protein [Flavobacteriaceae bacterium]
METVYLKNRIQNFLDQADERILNIVNGVFENYYENETVAYHPDGSPMSRKEYKMELDAAEEEIKRKEYIPVEELKQQLKNERKG